MNTPERIKLLAFASLVKSVYRNSVIYSKFTTKHHAANLRVHPNTFKKYLSSLSDLGLVKDHGADTQIVNLSDCIRVLLPDEDFKEMNHARFFQEAVQNKLKLKEIYNIILFSLVRRNYNQQISVFEKKGKLLSDAGYLRNSKIIQATGDQKLKAVKKLSKRAKAAGYCSTDEYVKEMRKNLKMEVVTGKFHVANLIGMSATTGANYLRKWSKQNLIERKKIVVKMKNIAANPYAYDSLSTTNKGGRIVMSSKKGCFFHFKGSVISSFAAALEPKFDKTQKTLLSIPSTEGCIQ